jgi:hypothetical protein
VENLEESGSRWKEEYKGKRNNRKSFNCSFLIYRAFTPMQCWHILEYGTRKHVFQFLCSSIPFGFLLEYKWNIGTLEFDLKYWNIKNYYGIPEFGLEY